MPKGPGGRDKRFARVRGRAAARRAAAAEAQRQRNLDWQRSGIDGQIGAIQQAIRQCEDAELRLAQEIRRVRAVRHHMLAVSGSNIHGRAGFIFSRATHLASDALGEFNNVGEATDTVYRLEDLLRQKSARIQELNQQLDELQAQRVQLGFAAHPRGPPPWHNPNGRW